jgi:site-specific DNA-methyltransferase (adenine-specific)
MMDVVHCCDYLELLTKVQTGSVAAVITDPPYGIAYTNNYTSRQHEVLAGDSEKFSYATLGVESHRVLRDNSAMFCFTGWSEYPDHYRQLETAGFSMKEPLICQKRPSGKTDLYGTFQTNADWLLFAHKGRFRFRPTQLMRNKRAGTVPNKGRKPVPEFKTRFPSCWFGENFPWSSENPAIQKTEGLAHPTIKGLQFVEWLVLLCTDPGDVILDPSWGPGPLRWLPGNTVAISSAATVRPSSAR